MISTGIFMFVAVAAFFTYLQPTTRRRVVGYGLIVDIVVWATMLTVFGGTGAERLGGVAASIGVTAFIHAYRYLFGYERRVQGKWVRFTGVIVR
jgi:uncharacterized membrane protein